MRIRIFFLVLHLLAIRVACYTQQHPYHGVFRELPVSSIKPQGWLKELLERQRTGLGLGRSASGQPFNTTLWAGDLGKGWDRYEQTAYMVDGLYRCGLLLGAKDLIALGEKNIRYVQNRVQKNGMLGPASIGPITNQLIGLDKNTEGNYPSTQWPFSVFSRAMMAYCGTFNDASLVSAMVKHYLVMPENFGTAPRDVNNIETICWLYGKTGNIELLETAERTWQNAVRSPNINPNQSRWNLNYMMTAKNIRGHGVSVCEQSKQVAILYLYTGKKEYLEAALHFYHELELEHGMADGVPSSDEGVHGKDPMGVHETCVIADYTWSLGYLLQAGGQAQWADKLEQAIFNAGLGAIKKDFKSHQYFSSANQFICTQQSLAIERYPLQHKNRQSYRPFFVTQCCTGNVHRIFPNFAARLWMSDNEGGLVAALYAPNIIQALVGKLQVPVTVKEKTDYPFEQAISFEIKTPSAVQFPMYFRIPQWAIQARLSVNGKKVTEELVPGTFFKLNRTFQNGDIIQLELPMSVRIEYPAAQTASVFYGPLLFSLRIKEKQQQVSNPNNTGFPAWDITPEGAWNYALAVSNSSEAGKIKIQKKKITGFPWDINTCPVSLMAEGRKIPPWKLEDDGTAPPMPKPDAQVSREEEQIQLVPMGVTALRLSVFPIWGD